MQNRSRKSSTMNLAGEGATVAKASRRRARPPSSFPKLRTKSNTTKRAAIAPCYYYLIDRPLISSAYGDRSTPSWFSRLPITVELGYCSRQHQEGETISSSPLFVLILGQATTPQTTLSAASCSAAHHLLSPLTITTLNQRLKIE